MSCSTMRSAVILSFTLLSGALVLLLSAELTGLAVPLAHGALLLALAAPLTLAAAFVIAILPGAEARLLGCQH
jgi:hypothetical protein